MQKGYWTCKKGEILQSENSNDILNSMQDEENIDDNYAVGGSEAYSSENPQTNYYVNWTSRILC